MRAQHRYGLGFGMLTSIPLATAACGTPPPANTPLNANVAFAGAPNIAPVSIAGTTSSIEDAATNASSMSLEQAEAALRQAQLKSGADGVAAVRLAQLRIADLVSQLHRSKYDKAKGTAEAADKPDKKGEKEPQQDPKGVSEAELKAQADATTAAAQEFTVALQREKETLRNAPATRGAPEAWLTDQPQQLGCGEKLVHCVDACTGRLIEFGERSPVAETQQVVVRLVGWERCRPEQAWVVTHRVVNLNVGAKPAETTETNGTNIAALPSTKPDNKIAAVEKTTAAAARAAEDTKTPTVPTDAELASATAAVAAWTAAVAADEAAITQNKEDLRLAIRRATTAAATSYDLGATRGQRDATQHLTDLASVARQNAEDASNAIADEGTLLALKLGQDAIVKDQAEIVLFLTKERKRVNEQSPAAAAQLKDDVKQRLETAKAVLADATQPSRILAWALSSRQRTAQQVSAVAQRSKVALEVFWANSTYAIFGDTVVTMPSDATVRQLIVNVKIQHRDPCKNPLSPGYDALTCTRIATSPDTPQHPDLTDITRVWPHVTSSLFSLPATHGNYYWDIGVVFALAPNGTRRVESQQRPGIPGDSELTVASETAKLTGIALNLYPGGHRRGVYSGFESKARIWDTVGLQLAFNPNMEALSSTFFGGLIFEPVTGIALSGGIIFLPGERLKRGYTEGMSTSAARSDYVKQDTLVRCYFGATFGFELFNTTAKRLPPKNE